VNRKLLSLFLFLLLIKSLLLIADHQPSFFFGDSTSYLATALANIIPYDRSFLYGFLLRPLVGFHSLLPVLIAQAALSCIACWIVGLLLVHYFRTSFRLAACCAIACAIEPLQLMSERFIMTETVATFGFAVYFWACCRYFKTGSLLVLAASEIAGVFIVGIRYSFLPVLLVLSLLVPLLSPAAFRVWQRRSKPWDARSFSPVVVHLLTAVLLTQALLFGYRHWYGHLAHEPAEYLSRDGFFLAADMAPIIKPVDFPIAGKRAQVFGSLRFPLSDPDARRVQRWVEGGICQAILHSADNNENEANRLARKTALRAIKRNPLGLLKLGALTYWEFFRYDQLKWALELNQGQFVDPVPNDVQFIRNSFGIDTSHRRFDSRTKRWESIAAPWCWFLVMLPPIYSVYLATQWRRTLVVEVVCAICSLTFLVTAVVPTEFPNPRYLTPLAWLSFVMIGSMSHKAFERG
jgi:hypothetical protein